VGDGACALNPEVSFEINTQPLQIFSKINKRVIFTSTCSVYGEHVDLLDETSVVKPLSVYASTKLAAENYLKDKNSITFRIGTLFGLGDNYSRIRMDLVINTLTAKAFYEKKLNIFGGDQYRPVLHVFDAARTIVQNLDNKKTGIYNISKENVRIKDLAKTYRKHFKDLDIKFTPMRFEDARNYKVSTQKAQSELRFKPLLSIDDGILELKKMLKEHRIKDIDSPRYTNQQYLQMFNSHLLKNDKK
jgi:nucleoside-diphosphate-sugar epimerase